MYVNAQEEAGRLHITLIIAESSRDEAEDGIKGIHFSLFLPRSPYEA